MNAVHKVPGKAAKTIQIDGSLASLQKAVGGGYAAELLVLEDRGNVHVALLGDDGTDQAKLAAMKPNVVSWGLTTKGQTIRGAVLVVASDADGEICSLSASKCATYAKKLDAQACPTK